MRNTLVMWLAAVTLIFPVCWLKTAAAIAAALKKR